VNLLEIVMNTSSCTRWVWRRCLGAPTDGLSTDAGECLDLAANRWHEESKRRYEELTQQWLEPAEQRQRCV
jgi:hypothetical protein